MAFKNEIIKALRVFDAFSFCYSNSRSISTAPILKSVPYWKRKHDLPATGREYGPLTDLPDWSYADGRPAPLTEAAKEKKKLQMQYCDRVIKLTKEVDECFALNKEKAELKEQKKQHFIQNRLKSKGKAFV